MSDVVELYLTDCRWEPQKGNFHEFRDTREPCVLGISHREVTFWADPWSTPRTISEKITRARLSGRFRHRRTALGGGEVREETEGTPERGCMDTAQLGGSSMRCGDQQISRRVQRPRLWKGRSCYYGEVRRDEGWTWAPRPVPEGAAQEGSLGSLPASTPYPPPASPRDLGGESARDLVDGGQEGTELGECGLSRRHKCEIIISNSLYSAADILYRIRGSIGWKVW